MSILFRKQFILLFLGVLFGITSYAQVPISGFKDSSLTSTKIDTFCSATTVIFTDTSLNSPTGWSWDFNLATNANISPTPLNSTSQNQSVVFSNTSNTIQPVTISLTTSNGSGVGNTATKTIYILPAAPTPSFTVATVICKDSVLKATNTSTGYIPSNGYFWSSTGSPSTNPSIGPINFTFSTIGPASITLQVTNACGSNSKTTNIQVVGPPTANFITQKTFCNNVPVNFTDASTGGATDWIWDFGNGDTSHHQNPVDSFKTIGKHPIKLTAINNCGKSTVFTDTITIVDCTPPVAHIYTGPTTVCMNNKITFYCDSTTTGPFSTSWIVNGATTYTNGNKYFEIASFNAQGNYMVILNVLKAVNGTTLLSSDTIQVKVLRCLPPVALFNSWASICQGTCTFFTNASLEGPFDSILWDFQGGYPATSKLTNPSNICYLVAGTYPVKMRIYNPYGYDSITKTITVLPAPRILSHDTCVIAGNPVTLYAKGNGLITWLPNTSLNTDTGNIVISNPVNRAVYTVHDTTTCPSPDSVVICLIYRNVKVSADNVFIPADGRFFQIKTNDKIPLNEFSMRIYNRWGEEVYKTSSDLYQDGWDGKYRGQMQNTGVYIYVIGYRDLGDNEYKIINGNFTLIR